MSTEHIRAIDFGDIPCEICQPKTLGECGHGVHFADQQWLEQQSLEHAHELGRRFAREQELRVLKILRGPTPSP